MHARYIGELGRARSPVPIVLLEDAPAGIAAAKAAGMRTIGLTTSHPAEKLGQADLVVARLSDVEPLLQGLSRERAT